MDSVSGNFSFRGICKTGLSQHTALQQGLAASRASGGGKQLIKSGLLQRKKGKGRSGEVRAWVRTVAMGGIHIPACRASW